MTIHYNGILSFPRKKVSQKQSSSLQLKEKNGFQGRINSNLKFEFAAKESHDRVNHDFQFYLVSHTCIGLTLIS